MSPFPSGVKERWPSPEATRRTYAMTKPLGERPVRSNRRLPCVAKAISPVRTFRTPHRWQGVVNLAPAI